MGFAAVWDCHQKADFYSAQPVHRTYTRRALSLVNLSIMGFVAKRFGVYL